MAKIDVKGENIHPIYKWLTSKELNGKMNSSMLNGIFKIFN